MRLFLFIYFFYSLLIPKDSKAQNDSSERNNLVFTSGIVSYYFWEENADGSIRQGSFDKPYLQNKVILFHQLPTKSESIKEVRDACMSFAHLTSKKKTKQFNTENGKFSLKKSDTTCYTAIAFIKKPWGWESKAIHNVLYFQSESDGKTSFKNNLDQLIINGKILNEKIIGSYMVYDYLRADKTLSYNRIVTYTGEDISKNISENSSCPPKSILLFVNGYRGSNKEKDESDDLVLQRDRYLYWFKIDDRFIQRLQPDVSYYADGSCTVKSSNHRSKINFTTSLLRVQLSTSHSRAYRKLNTKSNEEGFNYRKNKGKIAGLAFLYARSNSLSCLQVKDTLDIVCHSMGYAYTLGFLEEVSPYVYLRNLYILAPENANSGMFNWNAFEHVWQYGSNLDQEHPDYLKEQDGIAAQIGVPGVSDMKPINGGRVFIPQKWPNKHFVHSHMVYSYDWMFDWIGKGEAGYIGR